MKELQRPGHQGALEERSVVVKNWANTWLGRPINKGKPREKQGKRRRGKRKRRRKEPVWLPAHPPAHPA